jgi:hypothetical protein
MESPGHRVALKREVHMKKLVILLAVATGASFAQDVRYNFAPGQDFSRYRTFKLVKIKGADQLNDIADTQLKAAVEVELAQKGLTKATGDTADLLIGYQVSLGQEKQFTTLDSGWGYGPGWRGGWYGGGGGFSTTTSETIQIGQVDLDMYDAAQQKLVWRGTASKSLDTKAKPEKRQKNLSKSIRKLLKNYPPVEKRS